MSCGALYVSRKDISAGRTNTRSADCIVCGNFAKYAGKSIPGDSEIYVCKIHQSECSGADPLRDLPAIGMDWA